MYHFYFLNIMCLCKYVHIIHIFFFLLLIFTHLDLTQSHIRYIPQICLWLSLPIFSGLSACTS